MNGEEIVITHDNITSQIFTGRIFRNNILTIFMIAALFGCAGNQKRDKIASNPTQNSINESGKYLLLKEDVPEGAGASTSKKSVVEYITGTGEFINTRKRSLPQVSKENDGTIDLNFLDTDVRMVVDAVLTDMLSQEYILDPAVKGRITLQSNRSLGKTEVLMALEESLRLINVAMVLSGEVYHVMPLRDAPRKITAIRRPAPASANLPGFGVQAISLKYVTPTEMSKILQPFAAQGALLTVDNSRNLMLLAGTAKELATLQDLIHTFDVDWLHGMTFALFALENVEAKTIQGELSKIFDDASTPIKGMVKFIPMSRLNSLLAISHSREYLNQVEDWIKRLDRGGQSEGRKIYVFHVQNGKAETMASSLSQIFGGGTGSNISGSGGNGNLSNGAQNSSTASQSNFNRPNNNRQNGGAMSLQQLKIVPNVDDNSLLIFATPEEYGVISSALKQMDIPPRQVLIEATLAEVTLNDNLKYGVNWFLESGTNSFTFSSANAGSISPSFPGFSYVYTGSNKNAVLNALSSVTDVNVVSSPKLMVLNNQTATLQVGDQVPVAVQSAQATGGQNAPLVNTIEFRDTGVILTITPHINKGGLVLLEVAQEVSEVSETKSSGIDSPTIQTRKIETMIAAQNGETIALGGLIRETSSFGRSGVPFLKDIPLLGMAFSTSSEVTRRTELIILLTPRVITNAYETREAIDSLKGEFKNLSPFPKSALELDDKK